MTAKIRPKRDYFPCSNLFDQSKELCENPEKYHFKVACPQGHSVQCKGHRKRQCVSEEQICNGNLVSISSTFYKQLLCVQIPKAQKRLTA